MHDLSQFRANLDSYAARLATRGFQLDVEQFRALDTERRAAVTESEQLKAQRNAESQEISKLRKQGVDTGEQQQKVRAIGERIAALDENVKALENAFASCWLEFLTFRTSRCRWGAAPNKMLRCGDGERRPSSISSPKRIGILGRSLKSWTWNGRPRSPVRVLPFIGASARSWSAR